MSKQIKPTPIAFYITPSHTCPYLPSEQSKTLFLSPEILATTHLYSVLIEKGFRRSGQHIYRPECEACDACISVRIPVDRFRPNKNQRRCLKKGNAFCVKSVPATFTQAHYDLFENYIEARHSDGDMYPTSQHQYKEFLLTDWLESEYLDFYDINQQKLIATCVYDRTNNGLSAVYTFFDPDYAQFSLGRLAVLSLIQQAKQQSLDFVYLGYWVKGCQKMSYKGEYRPIQCFINNNWIDLT